MTEKVLDLLSLLLLFIVFTILIFELGVILNLFLSGLILGLVTCFNSSLFATFTILLSLLLFE